MSFCAGAVADYELEKEIRLLQSEEMRLNDYHNVVVSVKI